MRRAASGRYRCGKIILASRHAEDPLHPLKIVTALVAALLLASTHAWADDWPAKPIKLVVAFGAGNSADILGRLLAAELTDQLGQRVYVENRPGNSGSIGSAFVARAEPDGYTLGFANTSTHAATVALGIAPYDPIKDFVPVAMFAYSPFVLLVTPSLPVETVADLVAAARAKPGALNYASAGVGSMTHLAGALFASTAGVTLTHVPYRGTEQSVIDLMEGRIEILFGTIAPSLPQIRAGKLRGLATTGDTRNGMLPELPTLAESGLPGYEAGLWSAFVFPAGVSPAIAAKLNRETNAVMRDPDVLAALQKQGVDPETGGPDMLAARIKTDLAKWRDLITKAGIKAQ